MSNKKIIIGGEVSFGGRTLPLSLAVRAGDFVFLSGALACDENGGLKLDGDIREQTNLVMKFIEKQLAEAGCNLQDVVKSSVFLKNADDVGMYNEIYAKYFPSQPPARFTVVTDFVVESALIEIDVTAYKPVS